MCDLEPAETNVQRSLIWELMLYKFKQGHNTSEPTKNICCVLGEGTVDHSTMTRSFQKFWAGYNNLNDQVRGQAVLQAIEANQ